jgi:hypothetical protein
MIALSLKECYVEIMEDGVSTVAVIDKVDTKIAPKKYTEYVVAEKETAPVVTRLMDSVGENSGLDQQTREKLQAFENQMILFAEQAKEKGEPVGMEYFANYKPKLVDRVVGIAGVVGLAVLVPLIKGYFKNRTVTNKETGEIEKLSPVYKPGKDSDGRSELLKITTMDTSIPITEEQQKEIDRLGKDAYNPQIIPELKILRKLSFDELPQAAAVNWGLMTAFGIHSSRKMEARAKAAGFDKLYPEAFGLYVDANKQKFLKGVFGGYTSVARGKKLPAQFMADAITLKYMNKEAEPWILQESVKNVVFRRGAK